MYLTDLTETWTFGTACDDALVIFALHFEYPPSHDRHEIDLDDCDIDFDFDDEYEEEDE